MIHIKGKPSPSTEVAIRPRLSDAIETYNEQRAAIPERIMAFDAAVKACEAIVCIQGTFGQPMTRERLHLTQNDMEASLLQSAWKYLYNGLQIDAIASTKDRKSFELKFTKPDEFTMDNIRELFADYLIDPRHHVLKGLAECFTQLDPAYKSHDKVRIGVKGLPKRIIVESCGEYHGWGRDQVKDVLNCLNTLDGEPRIDYGEFDDLMKSARRMELPVYNGVKVKWFKNNNCHLIFDPKALKTINKGLAEFYGEVLPDSPEAAAERYKKTGTALSKDLAYYPTPPAAMQFMLNDMHVSQGAKVLEPSCGTGNMMKQMLEAHPHISIQGVEVHAERHLQCINSGLAVTRANFLDMPPEPVFDLVVMNPPFAGKHYQKHVDHAKKFLKPGGQLYAILPATARYDHGYCGDPDEKWSYNWRDLPVGSFKSSGTNVPTGTYMWEA